MSEHSKKAPDDRSVTLTIRCCPEVKEMYDRIKQRLPMVDQDMIFEMGVFRVFDAMRHGAKVVVMGPKDLAELEAMMDLVIGAGDNGSLN